MLSLATDKRSAPDLEKFNRHLFFNYNVPEGRDLDLVDSVSSVYRKVTECSWSSKTVKWMNRWTNKPVIVTGFSGQVDPSAKNGCWTITRKLSKGRMTSDISKQQYCPFLSSSIGAGTCHQARNNQLQTHTMPPCMWQNKILSQFSCKEKDSIYDELCSCKNNKSRLEGKAVLILALSFFSKQVPFPH